MPDENKDNSQAATQSGSQAASTQSGSQVAATQNDNQAATQSSSQAASTRPVQSDPDLMYTLKKSYDGKPDNKVENKSIESLQRGSIERKLNSDQQSQESK